MEHGLKLKYHVKMLTLSFFSPFHPEYPCLLGFWVETIAKRAAKNQTDILQGLCCRRLIWPLLNRSLLFCFLLGFCQKWVDCSGFSAIPSPTVSPHVFRRTSQQAHGKCLCPPFRLCFNLGICRKITVNSPVAFNVTVRIFLCLVVQWWCPSKRWF